MRRLGIPARDKTKPPCSPQDGIVFLGIHIRTSDMRFTMTDEHRLYAIDRINEVLDNGFTTKGDLMSIAGVLTWVSLVFLPGKPRRQHIYDGTRLGTTGKKSDKVSIRGPLQRQLQWWVHSLSNEKFVGSRIWDASACPSTTLVRSDASGEDGWGACLRNLHLVGPWPQELKPFSMLFKDVQAFRGSCFESLKFLLTPICPYR